jgi:hypothetical protein
MDSVGRPGGEGEGERESSIRVLAGSPAREREGRARLSIFFEVDYVVLSSLYRTPRFAHSAPLREEDFFDVLGEMTRGLRFISSFLMLHIPQGLEL